MHGLREKPRARVVTTCSHTNGGEDIRPQPVPLMICTLQLMVWRWDFVRNGASIAEILLRERARLRFVIVRDARFGVHDKYPMQCVLEADAVELCNGTLLY